MFLKNSNISSKIKRSKVTVYAALNDDVFSLCIYSDVLLQPRDLPLGSHFIIIIIDVNVIIIYFYRHVCE